MKKQVILLLVVNFFLLQPFFPRISVGQEQAEKKTSLQTIDCSEVEAKDHDNPQKRLALCGKSRQKRIRVRDDFFEEDKAIVQPKGIGKQHRKKRIRVGDNFFEEEPIKGKGKREGGSKKLAKFEKSKLDEIIFSIKHDPDAKKRAQAVSLLSENDPLKNLSLKIAILIEVLNDSSGLVRIAAIESLSKLSGEHYGSDASAWKQWWIDNKSKF